MYFLLNNAFKIARFTVTAVFTSAVFIKDVVIQGAINTTAAFIGVLVTQAL